MYLFYMNPTHSPFREKKKKIFFKCGDGIRRSGDFGTRLSAPPVRSDLPSESGQERPTRANVSTIRHAKIMGGKPNGQSDELTSRPRSVQVTKNAEDCW
jgi:hypothetical protein